ncbi:protein DDI1 homolog 2-like isoform X2 [Liolophura sinensis]|uniref:protein DDI1 homolog 2-like isoform X2 n=1 Tax=Liolophura sinensis TaxID=3198878 RepID=UPI003158AD7E
MQLTVTTLSDQMFSLDVSDDLELENFKALCEFETEIPSSEIAILWNGRPLHDNKRTLKDYGIKNGDVLLLQQITGNQGQALGFGQQRQQQQGGPLSIDFGSIAIPGGSGAHPAVGRNQPPRSPQEAMEDPKSVRDILLASPHELSILKERNPELADALLSGSLERFTQVFRRQQKERHDKERERMKLLSANPFDPEVQKLIAEEIRLKNVESNMETAMEFAPESFGQVVMLYIDCYVNGHNVKAFVDSGAQMTIMSQSCAERCNIMRLVDTRWAGIAKGVGTQKIIGRVHLGQIKIGKDFLQSSFSILEDQPMDMLLGLDMLKRHQCSIDLKRNKLVIGTTGTETPFLSEGDLPEHARLNGASGTTPSRSETEKEDQQLAQALAKSAQEAAQFGAGPSGAVLGSSSTPSGASSSASPFPEAVISRLMASGFSREQVIEELRAQNGNPEAALGVLLAKSLKFP